MLELKRHGDTWQVLKDGAVVLEGSLLECRTKYAELMTAQIAAKGTTRKRKIFA